MQEVCAPQCAFHASGLRQLPLLQSEIPGVLYRPTAPSQSFLTGAGTPSAGGYRDK